jgi:hypothetical protein
MTTRTERHPLPPPLSSGTTNEQRGEERPARIHLSCCELKQKIRNISRESIEGKRLAHDRRLVMVAVGRGLSRGETEK